ncbi:MAG: hypothetical protein HN348_31195, partial [Proteobacteria bacterium]|nr:hypothetical protein [Pseudomonadota bacterium]
YVPVDVSFEGMTWHHVGMRFKGDSTLQDSWAAGSEKLPFKLDFDEFEDQYPELDDQRFWGFKQLSFGNNVMDPSYLRDRMTADLFRDESVPVAAYTWARVFINDGSGSKYLGLYTLAEVPWKPMMLRCFGSDDGNVYKLNFGEEPWGTGGVAGPDSFKKKTNKDDGDYSDLQQVIDALHADTSSADAWRAGLEAEFAVDDFVRWLAYNTVIDNWDVLDNNAYFYGDPSDGRVHWIPWDFDSAFPNESSDEDDEYWGEYDTGLDGTFDDEDDFGSPTLEQVELEMPLARKILDDPVYWAVYVEAVASFTAGTFQLKEVSDRVYWHQDLIHPYVVGDNGERVEATFTDYDTFWASGEAMLTHTQARLEAVATFLAKEGS